MNEIQNHLVYLLKEIDEICTKNKIPYILGGRTAKDACQNKKFLGQYVYASIMMRGQDFEKFRSIVAKKEGRTIESILENPDFPGGMAMRYVDETTTFIYGDSAHIYKCKGIYITIQKCRNIPGNKYKAMLANGIEKTIDYSGMTDISTLSGGKQRAVKVLRYAIKVFGKARVIKTLLKLQNKLVGKPSKYLAYVRPAKDNINLPATMFTKVKRVQLEWGTFNVPDETDKYLEKVYAKKWKDDKKPEGMSARHLLVASTEVSYKDIDTDNALYANRAAVNEIIESRKSLTARIKTVRSAIEKYWDILFLTQERYRLYRKYKPVLDILNEHFLNRDYAWLNIVMKDYVSTVKTYLGKGWPVVVCPELDRIAVAVMNNAGEYVAAKKFEELKKTAKLKSITMELDERAREEAELNLPAAITFDKNNAIPVFLRDGEELYRVVRLDESGTAHPVLLKSGTSVILPPTGIVLNGEEDGEAAAWPLAVEQADGTFMNVFGSEWETRLFAEEKAIALIQHIYGRDIEIAWLSASGRLYITSKFGTCNQCSALTAPIYCTVTGQLEVPVSFFDEEKGILRELFCLNDEGERTSVVKVGAGGLFWVTPHAGDCLYYLNDEGRPEQLCVNRYIDEAGDDVKATLFQTKTPQICFKLVQEDAFGRRMEIAALYDDGSILPLTRMNADGTLTKLPEKKESYSTLCLKQSDGTTVTLATINAEGKIVSSAPGDMALPVGVIVTQPLVRNQTYVIGGSDGELSIQTTGYAL